jgi:hypothetical protein
MSIPTTDWRPISTDARAANGTVFSKAWNAGDDDEIEVDLAAELADGETLILADIDVELWLLAAYGEADNVEVPASVVGAPTISGTVVKQRINSLSRGRVYRLFIYFGAAGNHRSVTLPIVVNA